MKPIRFSNKHLFLIVAAGILISIIAGLLISKRLAHVVSSEVRSKEAEIIFGALESGPLAISRLNSSAIAQQELNRLMTNSHLSERGLVSVRIDGGPDHSFNFATWTSGRNIQQNCLLEDSRSFQFPDAINPFLITVVQDSCFVLEEEKVIFTYSGFACVLIGLVSALVLVGAFWPATDAIRKASDILTNQTDISSDSIMLSSIRDLVDKARSNAQLEKNAALFNLASKVSHDIRSPVTALNMIVKTIQGLATEEAALIKNATDRINQIANSILSDFNKELPAATLKEKRIQAGVSNIINAIVREKRFQFSNLESFEIVTDLQCDAKDCVGLEEGTLSTLLSNLINNSVEACSATPPKIVLSVRCSKTSIAIVVQDNGKGMSPELVAKIGKERLSQGKEGTASGSGIGLYEATKVIEAASGKFSIVSKQGEGTLVTLTFPRIAADC